MPYNIIEVDGVKSLSNERFPVDVEIHPEPHALSDTSIHTGKLDVSQLPDETMLDAEHQSDPHTMIIDGRDVSIDGAKLDTIEFNAQVNNLSDLQAQSLTSGLHTSWHHHDDFYYRKNELQTSGLSQVHWDNLINVPNFSTNHNHDQRYYTETELDAGQLDNRYYTEAEIDGTFALYYNKAEVDILLDDYYTKVELDAGQLDNRYFTETEITTNYYDKSETDILIAAASFGISGSVDTYADLPTPTDDGVIYIVKQTVGSDEEGFYRWGSGSWTFLANNTGTTTHNSLPDLNTGNYYHLTQTEYNDLTDGGNTSLHMHDDRYYIKSTIDTFLNGKSDVGHIHDDRYYTKAYINGNYYTVTQLNNGQLDNRYYTEAEIDTFLSTKSDVGHIHDDRYYTEDEVNTFMTLYYTKNDLDTGALNSLYYTEAEVDALLSSKSDVGHIHDDRYYTETELGSITDGSSGADLIGATPLPGGTANTVQGVLEEIDVAIGNATGSLDEAYDNNGSGSGREITVDAEAVKLNSTSAAFAPLELTSRVNAPASNLEAGQMAVINNKLFIFDGERQKWFTPSKTIAFGLNNNSKGKFLSLPGGMRDYNSGWKTAFQGTITSITLQSSNSNNNKPIKILINGSTAHTFYTDSNGDYLNTNEDVNFEQGDRVQVYVPNSGGNIFDVVVTLEYSWRP